MNVERATIIKNCSSVSLKPSSILVLLDIPLIIIDITRIDHGNREYKIDTK